MLVGNSSKEPLKDTKILFHGHRLNFFPPSRPGQTTQHLNTAYRNIVGRGVLGAFSHPTLLRHVGCRRLTFENGQSFPCSICGCRMMLYSFGLIRATTGMRTSSIFNTRHAKRAQHVTPNNLAICCVETLGSFCWRLQMLGQHCCDMLRSNVAIVWSELANARDINVGICCAEMLRLFG